MKVSLTLAMLCAAFAPQMVISVTNLRWCCDENKEEDGVTEFQKCTSMIELLNLEGNDLKFSCVTHNDCKSTALQNDDADLVSLDGGALFATSRLWDAVPILAEDYNSVEGTGGTSYHTVVAMKASKCLDTTTLASLKGMSACGTGYRKTAGWAMPIGTLLKKKIMAEVDNDCFVNNDAESAAAFFSGMCVPGASDRDVIQTNTAIGDKLCSSCKPKSEQGDKFCDYSGDAYAGYKGAFQCMADGAGDIAFIKHTTIEDYPFTASKSKDDYKLLCPQGGCQSVDSWRTCKWATVPSHAVVVNPTKTGRSVQEAIKKTFAAAQAKTNFKNLFFKQDDGSNVNPGDLIFKGSSYRLVEIDDDMLGFMGNSYGQYESLAAIEDNDCSANSVNKDDLQQMVVKAAEDASGGGGGGIPSWGVGVIVVISLICAGMLALILAMWKYERKGKPLFQPLIMENPLHLPA